MADKMYVEDIGTDIRLNCGVEINDATTTLIKVKKPDGTTVDWTATIYADNYLSHITVAGDLNLRGIYHVNAYIVTPSWTGRGETTSFEVFDPFQ